MASVRLQSAGFGRTICGATRECCPPTRVFASADETAPFAFVQSNRPSAESGTGPAVVQDDWVSARWSLSLGERFGTGDWYIEAALPASVAHSTLRSLMISLSQAIAVTALLAVLFGMAAIRRTLRPFEELLQTVSGGGAGNRLNRHETEVAGGVGELADFIRASETRLQSADHLLELLAEIDRKVLTSDSLEATVACLLPRIPAVLACRGAGALLITPLEEPQGVLYSSVAGGA